MCGSNDSGDDSAPFASASAVVAFRTFLDISAVSAFREGAEEEATERTQQEGLSKQLITDSGAEQQSDGHQRGKCGDGQEYNPLLSLTVHQLGNERSLSKTVEQIAFFTAS